MSPIFRSGLWAKPNVIKSGVKDLLPCVRVKDISPFPFHVVSRGTFLTFRVSPFPIVVASTFYFTVVPLIARRAEFHTRALAPLARSRLRDTHVSPSPSSSFVLVHLCTMCTTYGFLIVGSLVAFARERASITIIARRRIGPRFVGLRRPAFARAACVFDA